MNNPYSFTLPRNNDSPLSLEGKTKITTVLHHTRVFPCVIHPRLTVPGQLRNARKAYGPGMVHARSLQLLSPAAHLDLHFSLSSALSLVTPMTGRSEDPPAREKKYARRVRKVARNTPRCLRAPDAPVPLPPRQWRNSRGAPRSRGREELEGRRTRTFRIVRVLLGGETLKGETWTRTRVWNASWRRRRGRRDGLKGA